LGIHPFLLQTAFRLFAHKAKQSPDCWYDDLLASVLAPTGFVDANVLCFLWPVEFCTHRLLFISNPTQQPIFSHFSSAEQTRSQQTLREVLIVCDNEHYTL
jgi:hypothetical protein